MFENPSKIVLDRETALLFKDFEEYCPDQNIGRIKITVGIPRENGQVERRRNRMIVVLSKLAEGDSTKCYKFILDGQRIINSSISRSTII